MWVYRAVNGEAEASQAMIAGQLVLAYLGDVPRVPAARPAALGRAVMLGQRLAVYTSRMPAALREAIRQLVVMLASHLPGRA